VDVAHKVADLVAPQVSARGLDLYDVEHAGGVLRVMVEHPDGVDLALLSDLTRDLSRLLDEADPVPGRYTLEVSSPGLERRLRTPDHFQGAVGHEVTVRLRTAVDGDRRVTGPLESADTDGLVVDGRRFSYEQIERARTVFHWGPAAKPGAAGSQKHTTKGKPS
jgi:ribosome maturation factor RimP